jgi:hypothetical protein
MPWPLPNSRYINGSKLNSPAPEIYQISWYKVTNPDAKELDGWAIFTPWKNNKSMLYYRNRVYPEGILASVLKKIAPNNMLETITAIAKYIGDKSKSDPVLTEKYENYILRALKGEYVYPKIKLELKNTK